MLNVKRYFHDSSDDEVELNQSRAQNIVPNVDEETEDGTAAAALPQIQQRQERTARKSLISSLALAVGLPPSRS